MAKTNAINNKTSELTIDPGASGDSFVQFDINTTGEFRIGVYDTDDSFRMSNGSALGTTDTFVMTAAGERTMPLQPAFLAYNSSDDANQTGNGANAIVDFDTEIFDQGGDFAADTFTAPVTGRYRLSASVTAKNFTVATLARYRFETSNGIFDCVLAEPTNAKASNGNLAVNFSVLCDMDNTDTAIVTLFISGEGGDTNTIQGSASPYSTFFCGELIA